MIAPALIDTAPFTIEYKGSTFNVAIEHFGPGSTVYIVKWRGGGLFIALTRATGLNNPKFWATIPENYQRHEEAQEVGKLIYEHLNSSR